MAALSTNNTQIPYEDLKRKNTIRLIKLDPSVVSSDRGYKVKSFRLWRVPKFYALSYCWGTTARSETIRCNNCPLLVSHSLKQGLGELQQIPALAGNWFWIDQICVNQEDVLERTHQVKLMAEIYKKSKCTVVWLGPQSGPCGLGFRLAERIFEQAQDEEYSGWHPLFSSRMPSKGILTAEDISLMGLPDPSEPDWQQLKDILELQWFTRMWVIQEVTLSRKQPIVVYGGQFRSWQSLLFAGAFFGQNPFPNVFDSDDRNFACQRMLFMLRSSNHQWNLPALLLATKRFQSTDPRDKLFALISLAAGRRQRIADCMLPDYGKPVEQVYRDSTVQMIVETQDLALLSLRAADPAPKLPGHTSGDAAAALPSWVPRYDSITYDFEDHALSLGADDMIQYVRGHMQASKGIPAQIRVSEDRNRLTLAGLQVGKVGRVSRPTSPTSGNVRNWHKLAYWARYPDGQATSSDVDIQLHTETFLTVLSRGGYVGVAPSVAEFDCYYTATKLGADPSKTFKPAESVRQLLEYYSKRPHGFFVSTGLAVGVGPLATRVGDRICVLFGGAAAFILRQRDVGTFEFIGECYVSGVMDGEAVAQYQAGKLQARWFSLV